MSNQQLVKDIHGQILTGVKRSSGGGLVVDDNIELQKYRHEKQVRDDIARLKQEVEDLKLLVKGLLSDD